MSPSSAETPRRRAAQVDDFSLVRYGTLDISARESVARALRSIDKANGYVFGGPSGADGGVFGCAAGESEWDDERIGSVQERYMRGPDLSELLPGPGGAARPAEQPADATDAEQCER